MFTLPMLSLIAVAATSVAAVTALVGFVFKTLLWTVLLPLKLIWWVLTFPLKLIGWVLFFPMKLAFWALVLPIRLLFKLVWLPLGLLFTALSGGFGVVAMPLLVIVLAGFLLSVLTVALLGVLIPAVPFVLLGLLIWAWTQRSKVKTASPDRSRTLELQPPLL